MQPQVAADIALQQAFTVAVHQGSHLAYRHAPHTDTAEVHVFHNGPAGQAECVRHRTHAAQNANQHVVVDVLPAHLVAKTGTVDVCLRLGIPDQPVVARNGPDAGNEAVPHQRTGLLHPSPQPVVDGAQFRRRVKQIADGVDEGFDAGLLEGGRAVEVLAVLALKDRDRKLTVRLFRDVKCIHTKVTATLGQAVEGLLDLQVEHDLDTKVDKGQRLQTIRVRDGQFGCGQGTDIVLDAREALVDDGGC